MLRYAQKALISFVIWLIIPLIIFWYISDEFFLFGVIGAYFVLVVDYVALRISLLRHMPFAFFGLTIAVLIVYYLL